MSWQAFIPYLNFVSRWVLFVAVLYKAVKTKEKGWILLAGAFFVNAMDMESYILNPLGIKIKPDAYNVAAKLPNFFFAILGVWGAIHVRYGESKSKHTAFFVIFSLFAYIWLILLATDIFKDNQTLMALFPSFAFGLALIYIGAVLGSNLPPSNWIEKLFPWGLILLGILNLTYPVTRFLDWFAPIGFLMGALFRFMAAIGAVKFVFYPFKPIVRREHEGKFSSGAFLISGKDFDIKELTQDPVVLVTRRDVWELKKELSSDSLVFWITRAKEGKLDDSPTIYAISPTKIDILTDLVAKAIEQGYRVVYIDAFEYFMVENGFESTLKFLLNIKDRVISAGGTVFLSVDPSVLTPQQLRIIRREFEELS